MSKYSASLRAEDETVVKEDSLLNLVENEKSVNLSEVKKGVCSVENSYSTICWQSKRFGVSSMIF